MIKKFSLLMLSFLMVFGMLTLVLAQDNAGADNKNYAGAINNNATPRTTASNTDGAAGSPRGRALDNDRTAVSDKRDQRKDTRVERKSFNKLKTETREKFESLNERTVDKFSKLSETRIDKVKDIKKDRLRALASQDLEKITRFRQVHVTKIGELDRSRVKELLELTPDEVAKRLDKIKVVRANDDFRVRKATDEQIKALALKHKKLTLRASELKDQSAEALDKVRAVKQRVQECTEDCDTVNEEAIARVKESTLHILERITNHLEKIKDRLEGSQDLAERNVADKISKIDKLLEEVSLIKASVESATTKEELNEAGKDIRRIIKVIKVKTLANREGIIRAHTLGLVHRSEIMEKKVDCSLSAMDDEGIDTAAIDEKVSEFSGLIAVARAKLAESRDIFDSEDEAAVDNRKSLIREARDNVNAAREKLGEIRKDIRDAGGNFCTEDQNVSIEEEFESGDQK